MTPKLKVGDLVLDDCSPARQWVYRVLELQKDNQVRLQADCWGPGQDFASFSHSFARTPFRDSIFRYTQYEDCALLELVLDLG